MEQNYLMPRISEKHSLFQWLFCCKGDSHVHKRDPSIVQHQSSNHPKKAIKMTFCQSRQNVMQNHAQKAHLIKEIPKKQSLHNTKRAYFTPNHKDQRSYVQIHTQRFSLKNEDLSNYKFTDEIKPPTGSQSLRFHPQSIASNINFQIPTCKFTYSKPQTKTTLPQNPINEYIQQTPDSLINLSSKLFSDQQTQIPKINRKQSLNLAKNQPKLKRLISKNDGGRRIRQTISIRQPLEQQSDRESIVIRDTPSMLKEKLMPISEEIEGIDNHSPSTNVDK